MLFENHFLVEEGVFKATIGEDTVDCHIAVTNVCFLSYVCGHIEGHVTPITTSATNAAATPAHSSATTTTSTGATIGTPIGTGKRISSAMIL